MNWYYSIEGRSQGPITVEALAALVRKGEVVADTLVWHPGCEEWQPVSALNPEVLLIAERAAETPAEIEEDRVVPDKPPSESPAPEPAKARPRRGLFQRLFGRGRDTE